ncbi:hypothetical protein D3C78_1581630 [compost metagenome]
MGVAQEQADPERLFQAVHAPCHGRGRQLVQARGRGEAAAFQHGEEEVELFAELGRIHGMPVRLWHSHCASLCVSDPSGAD